MNHNFLKLYLYKGAGRPLHLQKMEKSLTVVIPCLNEETTLKSVLQDTIAFCDHHFTNDYDILVVDNGSADKSPGIASSFPQVQLLRQAKRGYGAALHYGIMAASSKFVLTLDADCSYPMSNLVLFKRHLELFPDLDLVLGSRIKGTIATRAMPFLNRYLGTPALSFLIRLLWSLPVSDCNSGMRLIRRAFYERLSIHNFGMNWASEVLVQASRNSCRYFEVPILFLKDQRNRPSHLSRWRDGFMHLRVILLPFLAMKKVRSDFKIQLPSEENKH